MVVELIRQQISQVLSELDISADSEWGVERPGDDSHGDYSSNVALVVFSGLPEEKKAEYGSPRALADQITGKLEEKAKANEAQKSGYYAEKIEVAGAGFINFWVSAQLLLTELGRVAAGEELVKRNGSSGEEKKVVVEYTDPNPFKEFHIGHLYSNIVGESIAKLLESQGHQVRRVCYQGDVGMHVAKSLWGFERELQSKKLDLSGMAEWPLEKRIEFLGQAYARGASTFKDDGKAKEEMQEINALVYAAAQRRLVEEEGWEPQVDYSRVVEIDEERLREVAELFRTGRAWSLEYFERIYRRLGTNAHGQGEKVFDGYYFESVVGEYGYKYVIQGLEKGVFVKGKGGAIVFPGDKFGLHTRVFVNAKGLPTYEAKDLGLAPTKYKDWAYDESYIVTGNEIDEYFGVVLKAMEMLEPELRKRTTHLSHGMVRLPEGKMSSRTGKVLKGEWLLDKTCDKVRDVFSKNSRDLSREDQKEVVEVVAEGAVKFALLSGSVGRDVIFDLDESISFEGKSGPYVQYTYARAQSVLSKFQETRNKQQTSSNDQSSNSQTEARDAESGVESWLRGVRWEETGIELNEEERAVLGQLQRFGEVVHRAAQELAPHMVAGYVYELAQKYNGFYNKHSILGGAKNKNQKSKIKNQDESASGGFEDGADKVMMFRLALTAGVARMLREGLGLLGIKAPERM